MPEFGAPLSALPSPKHDPVEIDVLPPSPAASVGPAGCTCKTSLLPTDGEAGEKIGEEGKAPATPPAECEDVVVVRLAEGEKV